MPNVHLDTPVSNKEMAKIDGYAYMALWYYRPVFRDLTMPIVHIDTPVLNKEIDW